MFAAIGSDGDRPVVWGLGQTDDEAIADANSQGGECTCYRDGARGCRCRWDSIGFATVLIDQPTVDLIRAGHVGCEDLGIDVTVRDGEIMDATWNLARVTGRIEITLDTPNGPVVEYGPDDDEESVESEIPPGWIVDWQTSSVKLATGRYRSPLVVDETDPNE